MTGVNRTGPARKLAVFIAAVLVSFAAATASPAQPLAQAPAAALKSCSSGYAHAVIGDEEKCLRAGQFCARRYDSQYRRYGYRCIRFYSNVSRYRLTRG